MKENRIKWADIYLGFLNGTIAEAWFKWIGWLLITAALYTLGTSSKTQVIVYFSYFSGLLTLLYALDRIEKGMDYFMPAFHKRSTWIKVVLFPFIYIIVMGITLVMSKAINSVFILNVAK